MLCADRNFEGMSRQIVNKGSAFELTLQITDKDGAPILVSTVTDILVLLSYKNGTGGRLAKFKKNAGSGALAWSADVDDTSAILCVVPEATINAAAEGDVIIGVKVKTPDGNAWTEVLAHELRIVNNPLYND